MDSATAAATDYSPAAARRALHDEEERDWLLRPLMARLERLESTMAEGFSDLQAAVDALGGEGGEISQAKDAILAAVGSLQGVVTTLQGQLTQAQAAVDAANQQLADAGLTAGAQAQTLQSVKAQFDTAEQQLNDAAAALQPSTPPA